MFFKMIIATVLMIMSVTIILLILINDKPSCTERGGEKVYLYTMMVGKVPVNQYKCVIEKD